MAQAAGAVQAGALHRQRDVRQEGIFQGAIPSPGCGSRARDDDLAPVWGRSRRLAGCVFDRGLRRTRLVARSPRAMHHAYRTRWADKAGLCLLPAVRRRQRPGSCRHLRIEAAPARRHSRSQRGADRAPDRGPAACKEAGRGLPERATYLPARVVEAVADYYHLSNEQVLQDTSTRQIAQMRQLVMYLVRELSGWSYPIVRRQCGNYHHTTVMYGVAMVKKRCAEDRRFCRTVETLLMRLSKKLPAPTQLSA